MRIGIIGIGQMGKQIALKLLAEGHVVTIWDRDPLKMQQAVEMGALAALTVPEALQGEIALSVLFDDDAIRTVLMGEDGLSKSASDLIHVCMSTVTMNFAEELVAYHARRCIGLVGMPMLGRPESIAGGGLNLLAAGASGLVDRIEPALGSLGRFWRLGENPPDGYCAKLAANFLLSGAIQAMAEAVAVLKSNSVDADRFIELMTETMFGSFAYKLYGPMVAGKPPQLPSGLKMPIKDNASFIAAGKDVRLNLPLATAVRDNFASAVKMGAEGEDWSTALAWVAQGGKQPT